MAHTNKSFTGIANQSRQAYKLTLNGVIVNLSEWDFFTAPEESRLKSAMELLKSDLMDQIAAPEWIASKGNEDVKVFINALTFDMNVKFNILGHHADNYKELFDEVSESWRFLFACGIEDNAWFSKAMVKELTSVKELTKKLTKEFLRK